MKKKLLRQIIAKSNQSSVAEKQIAAIKDWLDCSMAHLSNRPGYPRGYREGMFYAREIISDIIKENEL